MSIISHRVLQRLAVNSMTRRGSVIAASTYRPSTPESCLTSQPTSSPLPASRVGAITTQRRHFRQTSPRATPVVLDLDQIAFYGILAACAIFFVRHLTGYSTLPPHTWARTADESTRRDVEATMSVAFNTARAAPARQRHNKLREATFHVPHELARLNKEAPRFRLEDLGPLASGGKIPWVTRLRPVSEDGPPLDAKTETRAFLYFPDGSPKATAVFLAVNSELMYPRKALTQSPPVRQEVAYSRKAQCSAGGLWWCISGLGRHSSGCDCPNRGDESTASHL